MWALGRLAVLMSTWWIVNNRGPAAPVEPGKKSQQNSINYTNLPNVYADIWSNQSTIDDSCKYCSTNIFFSIKNDLKRLAV